MPSRRTVLLTPLITGAAGLIDPANAQERRPDLRLVVIADAHHSRRNVGFKDCLSTMRLLRGIVEKCRRARPDVVVGLGDMIEEVDAETDMVLAQELRAALAEFGSRLQCVPGNHDIRHIGTDKWEAVFGRGSFTSRSFDRNGFHLIFYCPIRPTGPYTLTDAELDWLRADLASTTLPAVIFTHVPIHASSLAGNGYFAAGGNGEWLNGATAREIIRNSTAALIVQGHTHWNALHIEDDVGFVTIPSLTETRRTMPHPSGSFSIIDMDEERISIRVEGRDSIAYQLRRRRGRSVWA